MKRKVVQITASSHERAGTMLIALAEDGTLWKTMLNAVDAPPNRPWVQIPDIPDRPRPVSVGEVL